MRREFMIQFREKHGIDVQRMAQKCKISKILLEMLERDDQCVTHPKIAERLGKAYRMNKKQIEGLMPEHYRKTSPEYNPDLYRRDDREYSEFAVMPGWKGKNFM